MIFFHGKGKKPNDPLFKPFNDIAELFNADLIPITAQFPHRDGFRWHNINKQPETKTEFIQSLQYIQSETDKILTARKQTFNDVVWLGYSQGSDLAIRMALSNGAKRVIVFSADILEQLPLPNKPKTDFQVDWIEAGKDNVLKQERKETYKRLQSMGIKVNYLISEKSEHFYIKQIDTIIENIDITNYVSFIKDLTR